MGCFLIGLSISSVYALLWQTEQRSRIEGDAEQTQGEKLVEDVRKVNQLVGTVQQRIDAHQPWSPALEEVLAKVPAEVLIKRITIDSQVQTLKIEGISDLRTAVVTLQQRLEGLPWVESIEAPLRNFATGPQGQFSFTLTRKVQAP